MPAAAAAPVVAPAPPSEQADVWARSPLTLAVGEGNNQWSFTFYGIIEANYIMDTTRSYDERIGSTLVA